MRILWLALLALGASSPAFAATSVLKPLQPLIDATPDGGVLTPPSGVYAGPATINRPMTLDGADAVVISGEGVGTVLILSGRQITLEHVKIEDSGDRHENLDSCLRLDKASFSVVRDNTLEGCLIGIDLREADSNVVRRN